MPHYSQWLDNIKQAWETKNFEVLAVILAEELHYFESPFLSPLRSKKEVVAQWSKDLEIQRDIRFDYDILHESNTDCFTHWTASFQKENSTVSLDGIFHFKLDANNQCSYFKQWWVVK